MIVKYGLLSILLGVTLNLTYGDFSRQRMKKQQTSMHLNDSSVHVSLNY
jgi:hypothetical protein